MNEHQNLVTAAENFLAKIREFISHKDLQCMAAIAQIHGYKSKLPSLDEEAQKLDRAINDSKNKVKEEAKTVIAEVVNDAEKVVTFVDNK